MSTVSGGTLNPTIHPLTHSLMTENRFWVGKLKYRSLTKNDVSQKLEHMTHSHVLNTVWVWAE